MSENPDEKQARGVTCMQMHVDDEVSQLNEEVPVVAAETNDEDGGCALTTENDPVEETDDHLTTEELIEKYRGVVGSAYYEIDQYIKYNKQFGPLFGDHLFNMWANIIDILKGTYGGYSWFDQFDRAVFTLQNIIRKNTVPEQKIDPGILFGAAISFLNNKDWDIANVKSDVDAASMILMMRKVFMNIGDEHMTYENVTELSRVVLALGKKEPLAPLTGELNEWYNHEYNEIDSFDLVHITDGQTFINKRCPHVMLTETGCYDTSSLVGIDPRGQHRTLDHNEKISFPYIPTVRYVDVPYRAFTGVEFEDWDDLCKHEVENLDPEHRHPDILEADGYGYLVPYLVLDSVDSLITDTQTTSDTPTEE